jgi:hypothetical protein
MADQYYGSADPGDHVANVRGVPRDAAQRVADRDDVDRPRLQLLDHAVPAGRFRERAVHQDDGGFLFTHGSSFAVGTASPRRTGQRSAL